MLGLNLKDVEPGTPLLWFDVKDSTKCSTLFFHTLHPSHNQLDIPLNFKKFKTLTGMYMYILFFRKICLPSADPRAVPANQLRSIDIDALCKITLYDSAADSAMRTSNLYTSRVCEKVGHLSRANWT